MPAQAQTTVWSAILTVDKVNTYFGCDNDDSGQDNCSLTSALSDDDFTFGGAGYEINTLYWESADNILLVVFNDSDGSFIRGPAVKTALKGLTLYVGGTALAINDASTIDDDSALSSDVLQWSYDPSTDWTDNQQISVSIEGPPVAQWSQATYAVTETDADKDLVLTINFSTALTETVLVSVEATGGTATTTGQNVDWAFGTCGFALSGATSATCTIDIKGDNVAEDAETIELTIIGATTGAILIGTQSTTTITITDDDSPPAAPTNLQFAPGDAKLGLAWDAPSGTVTGYDVHYTSAPKTGNGAVTDDATVQTGADSAGWVDASHTDTTASLTISSLTNGTAYRVRVRAVNANGNSDWLHGTGTPAVPAVPNVRWEFSTFSASEGDGTTSPRLQSSALAALTGPLTYAAGVTNPATLSADLGTTPATFTLTASQQFSSASIPLVDDALNEAHETFTVTIGTGTGYTVESPSVLTVTITDNDPPAAPGSFVLTALNERLEASWQKPAGPVTGYEVRIKTTAAPDVAATTPGDPSTGWVTGTQTTTRLAQSGVTNGTSYDVQVRATDGQTGTGNGYGPWTAKQSATPQLPAAPPNLQVTAGDTKLDLTWDAPSGTVNGYDVHYTSAPSTGNGAVTNDATVQTGGDSAGWVDASHSGTTASQEISSLTNGTAYRVRVRAKYGTQGNGAWVFGTGTPTATPQPPAAPTNLQVTAGDTQLDLTWDAPSGTVNGYDVHYTSAPSTGNGAVTDDASVGTNVATGWVDASHSGTTASQTISSLTNGTAYRVRVRAVNANGESPWAFGTGTPTAATMVPAAPTNLRVTPGNMMLGLRWDTLAGATDYDVHYTSAPKTGNGAVTDDASVGTNVATGWADAGYNSAGFATLTISSLTNGTAYRVRVRAKNANGASAWLHGTGTPTSVPLYLSASVSHQG